MGLKDFQPCCTPFPWFNLAAKNYTMMIIVRGRSQTTLTRRGRPVGGTVGKVNGMQKGIPLEMSTQGR